MADITNPTSNVSIYGGDNEADRSKAITSTTDGSKERLDVQALIDGGTFSLQPFVPVVDYDATGYSLTTTWYSLINYTGIGKLDFIACVSGSSNYKIRLTVDGSEIYDITMAELGALGLSNAVNVNMWAETALKNFRYRPLAPVDFTTSLKVEAAMTTGTGTLYWIVNYRVQS